MGKLRKLARKAGKARSGSLSLNIGLESRDAKELDKFFEKFEERLKDGMEYVLLEAALIVFEEIVSKDPDVMGVDYVEGLQVALVDSPSSADAGVCVYYDSDTRTMAGDDEEGFLFIELSRSSEPKDSVLQSWQPWPSGSIPVQPSDGSKVIFREASSFELEAQKEQISKNISKIKSDFAEIGVDVDMDSPSGSEGMTVTNDLAYSALRTEFGVMRKSEPHWRPAVKAVGKRVKKLGQKFVEYVINGKDSIWDLPDHGDIPESYLKDNESFQKKIARGSGVKSGY